MISFACKKVDIKDIIQCSFSLSKTEYLLLDFFQKQNDNLTTIDIAKKLNKDRTTIQKAIKSLHEKDIVDKRQINLESGGYMYVYKIKDRTLLKNEILKIIDKWDAQVRKAVNDW